MFSQCPCCNSYADGYEISRHDASLVRRLYKMYYSLIVPIPFVGSYIGGKIYDLAIGSKYTRHVCPDCNCSWVINEDDPDVKISGNENVMACFYEDSFVIGSVSNDFFMIGYEERSVQKVSIYRSDGRVQRCTRKYVNGKSQDTSHRFSSTAINKDCYIGETLNSRPDGWGITYTKDGKIWYGEWSNGKRDGMGFEIGFRGKDYLVGFWSNNQFVI